jgi:hypothetical protein
VTAACAWAAQCFAENSPGETSVPCGAFAYRPALSRAASAAALADDAVCAEIEAADAEPDAAEA